jgi:thiol-disulfide isomerase/thioredoxin
MRNLRILVLIALACASCWAASKPRADQVLADASKQAGEQHKAILLIFGATWCEDCDVLDKFLAVPEVRAVFDRYFVVVHLSVFETVGQHPELENVGADRLLVKFGGSSDAGEVALPFSAVLDSNGALLVNSIPAGKNVAEGIGYPHEPQEIAWFIHMLKAGAPQISAAEQRLIESRLSGAPTQTD